MPYMEVVSTQRRFIDKDNQGREEHEPEAKELGYGF
jgi:hypothetical protein